MPKGTIRRLITDQRFGFITAEQGEDLFFDHNELQEVDYSSLREGQQVEFEVAQEPDASYAVKVRLAQPEAE